MSDVGEFPRVGDVFVGRYRIQALLGTGGFARVYRAVQVDLGRDVALKVLRPALPDDLELHGDQTRAHMQRIEQRFNREARLISRLSSPYTVTMYDHGRTEGGLLYMTLEYVDGGTLASLIDRDGALAPDRVIVILRQVLESLAEAHAIDVLHRDIKPQNIMVFQHVGRADRVKVLDFGIAKALSDDSVPVHEVTTEGSLVGTPRYMSPEQVRGEPLAADSDLYSLGLVLFELLYGRPAIPHASTVQILAAHLDDAPTVLPEAPNVGGLRVILARLLAKRRRERFRSAADVLEALDVAERAQPRRQSGFTQIVEQPRTMIGSPGQSEEGEIPPTQILPHLQEDERPTVLVTVEDEDDGAEGEFEGAGLAFDPNLDEGFEPEFLSRADAASDAAPRGQRGGLSSIPREEHVPLELDRSVLPTRSQERRPVEPVAEPVRSRVRPQDPGTDPRKYFAIAGLVVVAAVVFGLARARNAAPTADADVEVSESVGEPTEPTAPPATPEPAALPEAVPQRYSTRGILQALQNAGWSHAAVAAKSALSNVHEEAFRLTRADSEVDLRVLTTTSTEAAQRMFDQTNPPVRPVVFDNKLVRVFPPAGEHHPAVGEIVATLKEYREQAADGVKFGR